MISSDTLLNGLKPIHGARRTYGEHRTAIALFLKLNARHVDSLSPSRAFTVGNDGCCFECMGYLKE